MTARARKRRTGRWVALGLVVLLLGLAGVAAWRVAGVARDLATARDLLLRAGDQLEQGQLGGARADLTEAEGLLLSANNRLATSPELDIVGIFPVAEQNLRSLRQSVSTAYQLVAGGSELLRAAAPLEGPDGNLQVPLVDGTVPLDVVVQTAVAARDLADSLPGSQDQPPDFLLLGPVQELQDEVFAEATERRDQLTGLAQGLTLLSELAGANGPRRYLLAVANTAEMRGTGGMVLSYGVLESSAGTFTLPAFGPIDELFLEGAAPEGAAPLADDEAARWSGLEPTRLWRNANLVPDFSVAGPRMEAMYETASGLPADGVIQIDVQGLAAILRAIGPVAVPGIGVVEADTLADFALNRLYFEFPDESDQRREVLGEIAEACFDRLLSGDLASVRPLAEELIEAVAQRHILFTSRGAAASRPIRYFNTDGPLAPPSAEAGDSFLLTVQNFGRDKLDYYLDTSVSISGTRLVGEQGQLRVEVTLTNTAPPGVQEPEYVFGTAEGRPADAEPGTYVGTASLYVPVGTRIAGSSGDGSVGALGTENGRPVIGVTFRVPAGGTATAVVDLVLPTRPDIVGPSGQRPAFVVLVPFPRLRPTVWDLDVDAGTGTISREGPLLEPEIAVESVRGEG